MARSYRHIELYEREVLELKKQVLTHKVIGLKYGFIKEQDSRHILFRGQNIMDFPFQAVL